MNVRAILISCAALVAPAPASAEPISALFSLLAATSLGTLSVFGIAITGTVALGATLLLNVGFSLLAAWYQRSNAPGVEEIRVNTRLPDAPRWQMAGTVAAGGALGAFAEYDAAGNFWFFVLHGDAEMQGTPQYLLENILVTVADTPIGAGDALGDTVVGDVLTDDFCLSNDWEQYEGSGLRIPIFRVYPVTPTAAQPWGDRPAAFAEAFPTLPEDFYLAGVAYTIVRCRAIPMKYYSRGYRWRGGFGLGEPSVAVVSNWNRMYDPRNGAHDIDDPSTWTAGDGNPVIIWAWFRTTRYGRNRPMSAINWTKVAEQADICDGTVLDRTGTPIPRYRGGFAWPDNKPRHECEREILDVCDGFVVYDDDGKAWPRVGIYEAPTLTFSAARDILSEQTQTVDDGEAQIDGVIVEYISPEHAYTKQPCAPWKNPNFFDEAITPNYRTIPILGCQNHNQAVRLAKAYGLGFGPLRKAALGTTIKGVLAKGERTISLDLDDEFQGDYQIATPVVESSNGREANFAVIPMQVDRYDLGPGEEGVPPAVPEPLDIDDSLEVAQNVVIYTVAVQTSSGPAVRLEATFDAPVRVDREFRFRLAEQPSGIPEQMTVDMDRRIAYSAIVSDGATYDVSWQTITAGGRATEWTAPVEVVAIANATPPDDLITVSVGAIGGAALIDWTTSNDVNQAFVAVLRGDVYETAELVDVIVAPANTSGSLTETIAAGDYTYWAVPLNGSRVPGNATGPLTVTVT